MVPADPGLRAVGESMLIDGVLPSEINRVVLGLAKEQAIVTRRELAREESVIREALTLDGASKREVRGVIRDIRSTRPKFQKPLILHQERPYRFVKI